ncbi:hypothetical protein FF1_010041 [Malus domestica]
MRYVHAADRERLELVEFGGGEIDGAYELGAPGGAEFVLPELGFGDSVDLNGAGKSMVDVRSKGLEPRRGCAVVSEENGRLAIGEGGYDGEIWEERGSGYGGGGDWQPAIGLCISQFVVLGFGGTGEEGFGGCRTEGEKGLVRVEEKEGPHPRPFFICLVF